MADPPPDSPSKSTLLDEHESPTTFPTSDRFPGASNLQGGMATGGDRVAGGGGIAALPEECISRVISLTSPRVACLSAAVSPAFRAAADSDLVWARFLPPECGEVLAQSAAAAPSPGSSKKELYRRLCDPVLIDDGKKMFSLERSTGKKCYMLSARDMVIVWGNTNTPRYWRMIPLPESRFKEAAEMMRVSWLEIRGKIHRMMLSPKTTYAAYLVFKLAEDARGLSWPSQEAAIKVGSRTTSKGAVCLQPDEWESYWRRHPVRFRRTPLPPPPPPPLVADEQSRVPRRRGDGWMEVLIGEFFSGEGKDDDGEVDVSLMETTGGGWKSGLIVEGMEIRPAAGGVEPRSEKAITCTAGTATPAERTSTSRCTSVAGRKMDDLTWDEFFTV